MITKRDIVEILNKLKGSEDKFKPYLSEAQFQFELAWELQKNQENYGIEKILLEYTACAKQETDEKRKKRFESDIIVLFKDKTYIAIELKYKTSEAKINDISLVQQAGQPGTKYDYLWDIHRIELLMKKQEGYEYYINDYTCVGGYAIFLTNDASYYNDVKDESTTAYHFRLCNGRKPKGELTWNVNPGEQKDWMKSREKFTLLGEYEMQWEVYYTYRPKNKEKYFKYLVTEIK